MNKKIGIIIADTQAVVRVGLKYILSENSDFMILDMVDSEEQLLESIKKNAPDVIIIDYNHPHNFGVASIKKIKQINHAIQILIISADNSKENILKVIENGALGFLTKECDEEEIQNAVIASAKGDKFLCHKVIDIIIENHIHKEDDCTALNISSRETEIIKLTAKGWSAKTIASHLFLSTHTVYTHKKNIMKKLKLKSTSEIIVYAIQNKLIEKVE
jgi:DNA-binding NarL/FixJ family response regulator